MGKTKANYFSKYRQEERKLEKIIGTRYRTDEARPGETFTQFKERIKKEKKIPF